jgi:proteic killer suppression protein
MGQFALDLWGPYRLIFEPANDPVPKSTDRGVDREQVTEVRILEIVDYHGE